jgi:putative hemolysin
VDEDPNRIFPELILILFLVACNAFFAAAEIALVTVRRTRIKQLIEEGNARAETVQKLLERPTSFMATVQIGVTLLGFLASAIAAVNLAGAPAQWLVGIGLGKAQAQSVAVLMVTILLGLFTLVFGEIAPKSLAMQHSEWMALHFATPLRLLSIVAAPLVKVVSFLSDLAVRPFGGHVRFTAPILTEEELRCSWRPARKRA